MHLDAIWRVLRTRTRLTHWILVGLIAGAIWGACFPGSVGIIRPFQGLFLRGIKSVIAPLVFSTIVVGIASAGSFKQLGKIGLKAFIYFEVVTTLALIVGLIVVNLLQPGASVERMPGVLVQIPGVVNSTPASDLSFGSFLEHLLPINLADAVLRGDVLQIVLFSTLFAFGVLSGGVKAEPILVFCESLASVMFNVVRYVMNLAPLGVCAAVADTVSQHGAQVVIPLAQLLGSLYLALFLFVGLVLYPIARFYGVPIRIFVQLVKDPVLWAFATTSSESAYPMALERLHQLGVPRRIVNFVLPMGYSFNLDGSTLYLSLAFMFVVQVARLDLGIQQQIFMMLTLIVSAKGVAAVPRASIVVLSATLSAFNIPLDGVALILGVDAFMDMGRSGVNLLGNCLAAAVIARSEGVILGQGPTDTARSVGPPGGSA